ncbi:MAG: hypothetical protein ACXWZP_08700 [Gaiellaceae bacterium]
MLVALAGVALLVPAIGVAAVREDPPVTTPVETVPPLPDPAPPVEPEAPPEPPAITITIEVPPLPEPVVAAPRRTLARPALPRAQARRVAPARVERVAKAESRSRADVAPVVTKKPTPKAKPKQKLRKPRRRVIAPVSAPQRPIREHVSVHGVLAAQFSAPDAASPATTHREVLYLALALAAVLGTLLGLVVAAPALAGRWPQVFVPVIDASEQIVLAGVCLACAALTLAITWALTGPGA